jgi:mono/diheme cytochrome c family protein
MKTALTLMLALSGATFAAQAQEIKGDAARGATLNASCIGCHGIPGYQSSFPEVHHVPAISPAPPVTARISTSRSTARTRRSPASTPTTCSRR